MSNEPALEKIAQLVCDRVTRDKTGRWGPNIHDRKTAEAILALPEIAQALATHDASPAGEGETGAVREAFDWPGQFSVHDPEPDNEHSALYLVFPNGLMANVSCDAREGLDMQRAEWMVSTLNTALNPSPPIQAAGVGLPPHHHKLHPWAQPGDRPERQWFLRFDDRDMREQRFSDEATARAAYAQYSPAWNCYLYATVEASPSPVAAPAGWRMVPETPTPGMMIAGMAAPRSEATRAATNTFSRHEGLTVDIWAAMLAASPPLPASGGGVDQ